jgi:hypothetical protein
VNMVAAALERDPVAYSVTAACRAGLHVEGGLKVQDTWLAA